MCFQYMKGLQVLMYGALCFRKYMIYPLVLMIYSDRITFEHGNWVCHGK